MAAEVELKRLVAVEAELKRLVAAEAELKRVVTALMVRSTAAVVAKRLWLRDRCSLLKCSSNGLDSQCRQRHRSKVGDLSKHYLTQWTWS